MVMRRIRRRKSSSGSQRLAQLLETDGLLWSQVLRYPEPTDGLKTGEITVLGSI